MADLYGSGLTDFFAEEGEDIENTSILPTYKSRAANLAAEKDQPPDSRAASNFVGLWNQGATCYLNSLIQACFMTPELRKAILDLPLCNDHLGNFREWLPEGQKREILFALQELFVKLQAADIKALPTKSLTDSFHWSIEDVVVQQDAQELNRVLFDVIERALQDTPYANLIGSLYRGINTFYTECSNCNSVFERDETFCDLVVQVKGMRNLEESIAGLLAPDFLEADNKYFCEVCNAKQNATRRNSLKQIPNILTFSLNRFEYDLKTFDRVKITDPFGFPVELDMNKYTQDGGEYELFGTIIHAGTAHQGHYHAYIRDLLQEGSWNVPETHSEPEAEKPETQANSKPVSKRQQRKQDKTLKALGSQTLDIKDANLLENWYDFNDSSVTAISGSELSKIFGGSKETAYMLIYRKKIEFSLSHLQIPSYWSESISIFNSDLQHQREEYEELKNWLEVAIQSVNLFSFDNGMISYNQDANDPSTQGKILKLRFTDQISEIYTSAREFNTSAIVETARLTNGYVQLLRFLPKDCTLQHAGVRHRSCWIAFPERQSRDIVESLKYVGEDCEPIVINMKIFGDTVKLACNRGWKLDTFQQKLCDMCGITPSEQVLRYTQGKEATEISSNMNTSRTLGSLGFYSSMELYLTLKEEDFPEIGNSQSSATALALAPEGQTSILVCDENDADNVIQHCNI
jgi:ubiquitin carboxyl-terminal hydrolase 40